jgi:protein SCO1/2
MIAAPLATASTVVLAAMLASGLSRSCGDFDPPAPAAASSIAAGVAASTGASLDERLGSAVPRDVELTDHRGRATTMGELLDGERPVVLVLAYYRCPMLCGLTLQGLATAVRELDGGLAGEYLLVTASFDPRDGPADAERARATTLEAAGLPATGDAWPFLTAAPEHSQRLAEAVGFHYAWDARTEQYAHPAVTMVLTPDGTVARYLHGFRPPPLDLRLSLVEAGRGRVGGVAEQALVTCYRYDPASRRYGFHVLGFLRIAGTLVLLTLVAGLFVVVRADLRRTRAQGPVDRGGRS